MTLFPYILVFVASFLVDCIPVFAPPAWTLMLLIMLKYELNPWIVVVFGTFGTVGGRLVFSQFIVPWLGNKTLGRKRNDDLKYLGTKLSKRGWPMFFFVFLYSLLPLSTTALFTAAGLAKVSKLFLIPPFFLGNLIGDAILLTSGKSTVSGVEDLYKGSLEPKSLIMMALGALVVLGVVFVDWRQLLEKKKLRFKWKFWE